MKRTVPEAIHELCLSLPGTEMKISHGAPHFRVSNRGFAIFVLNHHGDGRVALWLAAPPGNQRLYIELNPAAYFIPPYVGPRGWLGVELNKGLSWQEIVTRVHDAYKQTAAGPLVDKLPETIETPAPSVEMSAADINPMLGDEAQAVLDKLAGICASLPETSASDAQGLPAWKAGKKTFVRAHHRDGRLKLQFWVGIEQQAFFTADERFDIPMYLGNGGWIDLDVHAHQNWAEIESLAENSYRHFALKRMLKALDGPP